MAQTICNFEGCALEGYRWESPLLAVAYLHMLQFVSGVQILFMPALYSWHAAAAAAAAKDSTRKDTEKRHIWHTIRASVIQFHFHISISPYLHFSISPFPHLCISLCVFPTRTTRSHRDPPGATIFTFPFWRKSAQRHSMGHITKFNYLLQPLDEFLWPVHVPTS